MAETIAIWHTGSVLAIQHRLVSELVSQGRFSRALQTIGVGSDSHSAPADIEVIRAELYELVGLLADAKKIATRILQSKPSSVGVRAACEYVLAKVHLDQGDTAKAIAGFQRAVSFADNGRDLDRGFWARLRLLNIFAERSAPEPMGALLSEVRSMAVRSGNPQALAALHIYVGQNDAKRGLLRTSRKHTLLGQALLKASPNIWLNSIAEITLMAVSIMANDFTEGLMHGHTALAYAEEAGAATALRASLGNLGNVLLGVGRFDEAFRHFDRALAILPYNNPSTNASLDGIARLHLFQGRLEECKAVLEQIDESIHSPEDRLFYPNRYAQLTRTQLAMKERRWKDALTHVQVTGELAKKTDDIILSHSAALASAEILHRLRAYGAARDALSAAANNISDQHPDLLANYERVLATTIGSGDYAAANAHLKRSKRICESIQSAIGLIATGDVAADLEPLSDTPSGAIASARLVVHSVAAILQHAQRPSVQRAELMELLRTSDCADEILKDSHGDHRSINLLGVAPEEPYELWVRPRAEVDSIATVSAIAIIMRAIRELSNLRAACEDQATLWPADELSHTVDGAVVSGHMRELLGLARRIGPTNVTVLITGESGTGKEILARAIHTLSPRADKPFIPFNCAAIPRDILESQLFGHRRGAFTGADRDQPGVVRAARDGTLVLDEIGEMSLDLQPKLLRFLESGEISPLGEPSPLRVDVRVIAATNANLETLVREGRFREDLYYRLNVFRLHIRPLRERRDEIPSLADAFAARAAAEFHKGRLTIGEDTMEHLLLAPWPGNVRQLLNEIRRMVALAEPDATLAPSDISSEIRASLPTFSRPDPDGTHLDVPLRHKLAPTLARVEREMITLALHDSRGRLDAAARALGISRKGLYLKRQRLGL
ncbi:MAG: sigma 54-interacting transcriptional regulator [Acidobacteria bacterium]|nr:sigma 54-interacting transcriptional regulator [Acidobacteriota bacterium]